MHQSVDLDNQPFTPPIRLSRDKRLLASPGLFPVAPSAVAHDDVCKSHKHLSYMAREEMRRQTLAKKQALIALFLWLLLSCFLLWFLVEPVFNHMHSLTKGRQGLNVNEVMKRLQEVEGLQTSLISNPPIHQQRIFKMIPQLADIPLEDLPWTLKKVFWQKLLDLCSWDRPRRDWWTHICVNVRAQDIRMGGFDETTTGSREFHNISF